MISLKSMWPYLLVALLGAAAGAGIEYLIGARRLADEQAARASDAQRHAGDLAAILQAALDAERRAIAVHDAAASQVAAVDAQVTRERADRETENLRLRAALAAGTDRLRVVVRNCSSAGAGGLPDIAGTPRVGDGAAAYADLDRTIAERVFGVTGDDDAEIDKLRMLQRYVCSVRQETVGCS